MALTELVEGPGWAPQELDVRAGRFPLSVESHLINMTARLVPGATTVTINARYYALHALVALEAQARGLELGDAYDLLRRCEVVVAAASLAHPDPTGRVPHGYDRVHAKVAADGGTVDVEGLAVPQKGYAKPQTGFLNPYVGSELTLRALAEGFTPGGRVDEPVLRAGFPGLFDVAAVKETSLADLEAHPELSISAAKSSSDGVWLRRLLCSFGLDDEVKLDVTRRGTVRLLARSVVTDPHEDVVESFRALVAYGPGLGADPVAAAIPEGEAWRGVLFRHDSVGAWRWLWAWLVDQFDGDGRLVDPKELVDVLVAELGSGTLGDFADALPATVDEAGDPAPAEELVRVDDDLSEVERCLALLVLGARRSGELNGTARAALVGDERRPPVLSPLWVAHWVGDRRDRPMADVGAELVRVLLDRARRVALKKMRWERGHLWLPTRVHERGEFLYRTSREGGGNVGLRLHQLAGLLAALDVLDHQGSTWAVTPVGEELLAVGAP